MNNAAFWENIFSNKEWGKYPSENLIRFIARNENLSSQIDEIKIGDYEQKLDEFKDESFDCIIDSCSLCCNNFEKTKHIFDKAILKLKPNGKFFSSTIAKGIVGYDKNKEDFQLPNDGIYTHVGMIRFSNKEDIQKLYKNDNFKQTSLKVQSIEDNGALIDKLFIIEGEKNIMGGGTLKNSYKEWKMSRIFLEDFLKNHKNYSYLLDDIYLNKKYASLYGEVFEFSYQKEVKLFKMIAIKEKIPNTKFYDLQSPYGYGGIYCNVNDKNFIKEALENLKLKAVEQNIIAFFIRFHLFDENLKNYHYLLPFFTKNKETIIVNTNENIENIRTNYSPRIRSYIKKARKEINIEFAQKEDYKDFFKLYTHTMQRNNADKFYFFNERYFEKLFNFKESIILKASLDNKILAFASFFLCGDFSYYHLSANSLKSNANAALLDFFFEYANQNACKFCFLGGGVQNEDTLFKFKEKFSTLRANFYVGGMIFNKEEFDFLNKNFTNKYFLKYRFDD